MRLMAMDTTSQHGSLALFEDDDCVAVRALQGRGYAATLIPAMQELLQTHQLAVTDLHLIAVANGPGSFTGVRIGLATVKALMETSGTRVVAVGTLEAIASLAETPTLAVMDAGRNAVYVGAYPGGVECEETAEAFTTRLAAWNGSAVTPDAGVAERWPGLRCVEATLAPAVGRLARARWQQRAEPAADVLTLDARYLGARWGQ